MVLQGLIESAYDGKVRPAPAVIVVVRLPFTVA